MMLGNGKGAEIVGNVRDHTFPHTGWGRGHKISKEQIVGLVVALEIFVEEGDSLYAEQMRTAEYIAKELEDIPGYEVTIIPNDETLHEHPITPRVPRVLIRWDPKETGITGRDVDRALAEGDPPIFIRSGKYYDYFTDRDWRQIDPFYLREGEAEIVASRMRGILAGE